MHGAPLLLLTIAFLAGVVLSKLVGPCGTGLRLAVLLLPLPALLLVGGRALRGGDAQFGAVGAAFVLAIAAGVGFLRHETVTTLPADHVARLARDEPTLTRIAGTVVTAPLFSPPQKRNPFLPYDPPPRVSFVLSAEELRTNDTPAAITGYLRVNVEAAAIDAGLGDRVEVTGWLYRPIGRRNPGEKDWAEWNRLQHIHAGLSIDSAALVRRDERPGNNVYRLLARLRGGVRSLLFEPQAGVEFDRSERLLDTMVLGQRTAAGREINEAFLRTGSIHFLSVSGFHVVVLAGSAWWLVGRLLRRSLRAAAAVTITVIVLYVVIAEQNAPILRAGTMGVLLCLAQLLRRPPSALNWLALAALLIVAADPLELFRAGFQLSFVQMLVLMLVVPPVYWRLTRPANEGDVPADVEPPERPQSERLRMALGVVRFARRWIWRAFVGALVTSVCAWLFALPLTLFHFQRFTPWAALQTVLITPLVIVVIDLAFVTLVAAAMASTLGGLLNPLLRWLTELLLSLVDRLAGWPGTLIETPALPTWLVAATYALAGILVWQLRAALMSDRARADRPQHDEPVVHRRNVLRRALTAVLASGAMAGLWIGGWRAPVERSAPASCALHVLAVDDGSAALLIAPGGEALLFDVGTLENFDAGRTAVEAARALGVRRLSAVAISHANLDHFSGLPTVLDRLAIARVLVSPYFASAMSDAAAGAHRLRELLPDHPPAFARLEAGDQLELGGARLDLLWPPSDLPADWVENDRSLVVRVTAYGRRILLTGDIQRGAIRQLLAAHDAGGIDLRADVLIAPHHGSVLPTDSEAFYRAVAPQVVIASTGKLRPKLEELVRQALGPACTLYLTRRDGAVAVQLVPGGEIRIDRPYAGR